jgi:cell wall-associated NlpC family hydrolase
MSVRHPGLRRALIRPAAALAALCVTGTAFVGAATPAHAAGDTPTVLTVSPAKVTKPAGAGVTFTWKLTSNGAALAGKPVALYTRATSASTWTKVATHTTSSSGVVAMAFTVRTSTYALAKFFGDTTYAGTSRYGVVLASSALGQKAVTEAARHVGKPYQWGAVGPDRFDCSGYTRYVFGRLGKSLPHNSGQQYGTVRHIAKSSKQVGDLIFTYNSGGIYHVAIYAGNGYIWHAPHSGDVVKKSPMWTTSYYVGRVG